MSRSPTVNMSATTTKQPVIYGQVVVGPPGSGKTTYCNGMQQFLRMIGRDAWVLNCDPANEDYTGYECLVDISRDVISLQQVMEQLNLGPNGGLLYCMEYLEHHVQAVVNKVQESASSSLYLILDFPGQVELYTHGTAVSGFLQQLTKRLNLRLCAVNLIDGMYCTDATKFLSAALVSTTTMLRLELPMVNVLSKIDLLQGQSLPFSLDFFTECQDLSRLVPYLDGGAYDEDDDIEAEECIYDDADYQQARQRVRQTRFYQKHQKMHELLSEVVEDFGLLSFIPLEINSAESVGRVLSRIDKCNGYIFTSEGKQQHDMFECAVQSETSQYEMIADIQERMNSTAINDDKPETQQSY